MRAYLVQQGRLGREEPQTLTTLAVDSDLDTLSSRRQDD